MFTYLRVSVYKATPLGHPIGDQKVRSSQGSPYFPFLCPLFSSFFLYYSLCLFCPHALDVSGTPILTEGDESQFSCYHSLYFLFGVGVILRESDGRNYYNICFNDKQRQHYLIRLLIQAPFSDHSVG